MGCQRHTFLSLLGSALNSVKRAPAPVQIFIGLKAITLM